MRFSRYAVLGSNSFAGAAFVARAIEQGAEVVGFNRSAEPSPIFLPYQQTSARGHYAFVQADINHDITAIKARMDVFRPQVVVDFAGQGMVAESWQDPAQWYQTNIVAKVRLHEYLRNCDWLDRYMRISTPEVYGSHETPLEETWHCNPSTPYALSHTAIDLSLRAYHQHYKFPVLLGRFANFYGPGQQLYRIIPRTIIYALTGRKLQLHGGGTAIRAFIYSTDIADGILCSLEAGNPGEIYHFSPERFFSIREIVEIICKRMGVEFASLAEIAPDRPAKDQAYLMNSTRARTQLGWRDKVSIEQGIDQTIDWVKRNLDEIKSLPLNYIHKA